MARDIPTIISELDAAQADKLELAPLNSPSKTAIYTLWKGIVAIVINYMEQLWDLFRNELEVTISKGKVGSSLWVQDMIFKFQYSATNVQVVQVVNYAVTYYIINPILRIITRCSVTTAGNKIVSIKVAKLEPPQALTVPELTSLRGYVEKIGFAGVQYEVNSYPPDLFYLKATIYYDGQYFSVIESTVIAAITSYFASLKFDGTLQLLTIEDFIQKVDGVKDIVIEDAAIRADSISFANATYLVKDSKTFFPTYPTFAGYVIPETTVGYTLVDQLTFVAK